MSDSGRTVRTAAELNAEANTRLAEGLDHDLRTALRLVCISPYTVADSLYPRDAERADFLAQQLKAVAVLLKG